MIRLYERRINVDIISIIKSWLERHLLPEKGLFYIGGSDTLPPPLDKADEEKAIIAMENGDESAKKLLTEFTNIP